MLCLTRKPGQKIFITDEAGERVEVIVLYVKGNFVKLGFEASNKYVIHRAEVQEKVDKEI